MLQVMQALCILSFKRGFVLEMNKHAEVTQRLGETVTTTHTGILRHVC